MTVPVPRWLSGAIAPAYSARWRHRPQAALARWRQRPRARRRGLDRLDLGAGVCRVGVRLVGLLRDRHRRDGGADRVLPADRVQPVGVHGGRRVRRGAAQRQPGPVGAGGDPAGDDRRRDRRVRARRGGDARVRAGAGRRDLDAAADRGRLRDLGVVPGRRGRPAAHRDAVAGGPQSSVAVGGGLVVVAFLAIAVFVASRVLRSDIGLELFVLGVDERTAAAMGVRTPRRKLELFVLGCVFASLGGAAYAGTQQFVPETIVDPTAELALLIMLFIGGRRSIIGAVVGALVIQYLQGASSWVSVNILVVEGVLLTVVLLVDAEGLAGIATAGGGAGCAARAGRGPAAPKAALAPHRSRRRASRRRWPRRARGAGSANAPCGASAPVRPARCRCWRSGASARSTAASSSWTTYRLSLPPQGLFGLCGPNGAGKSTLLNVIGGSVRPSAARCCSTATDISRRPPHERFGLGISRTFQAVHLIKGRTVLDNVAVSCLASHQPASSRASPQPPGRRAREGQHGAQRPGPGRHQGPRGLLAHAGGAADGRARPRDGPRTTAAPAGRARLGAVGGAAPAARGTLTQLAKRTCVLLVEHDLDLVARSASGSSCCPRAASSSTATPKSFRASPIVTSLLVGL